MRNGQQPKSQGQIEPGEECKAILTRRVYTYLLALRVYAALCESHSVVPNSLRPHGLYCTWNSLGQNTGVGSLSLLQGILPTQGLNPGLLHCRADSLPIESPGKPKNTRVGSLSLLQWIFLTQELNQGLLHYRQILYQLSYHGSPF